MRIEVKQPPLLLQFCQRNQYNLGWSDFAKETAFFVKFTISLKNLLNFPMILLWPKTPTKKVKLQELVQN